MFHEANKKARGEPLTPTEVPRPAPTAPEEPTKMMTMPRDPTSRATETRSDLNALLGKGSEFEGKLTFEGMVRIDGKFTGQITTNDTLVIGEGARVSAEISCGSIVVHGELSGNVKAKTSVELHSPAKVYGDIATPSLLVEKGVVFVGASKMEDLERETAARSTFASASATESSRASRNGPQAEPAAAAAAAGESAS